MSELIVNAYISDRQELELSIRTKTVFDDTTMEWTFLSIHVAQDGDEVRCNFSDKWIDGWRVILIEKDGKRKKPSFFPNKILVKIEKILSGEYCFKECVAKCLNNPIKISLNQETLYEILSKNHEEILY